MQGKKSDQDFIVINITDDFEVRYWSKKFGVSRDTLKRTVHEVGNSVLMVQRKLQS